MKTIITRVRRFDGKRYWLTTASLKSEYESALVGPWSNYLYLHFAKEDFPFLKYPELVQCEWLDRGKRFDYNRCDLGDLDWHGGCMFYEESFLPEIEKTLVRVGCDYQHYLDTDWMSRDSGEEIIITDGDKIIEEFERLCERRSSEPRKAE